ncbi:hypothetical protein O3G_MSEX009704 [Manduca sexta]|uniref:Odorant receptor n=1 Tax=Manduca sexta TaxID=7130 RepID=A0A921ZEM6_MANSE|nr:hypothetical protein O3G_MSEX009704 [Manduca sexta]
MLKVFIYFPALLILGTYLIIQVVDLFLIWGDLPLMTGTAFLLFTNVAQFAKIINILSRRERIQRIIDDADAVLTSVRDAEAKEIVRTCDRETKLQLGMYSCITLVTAVGWAASAEKNKLPLRAWYPYDTSKSPAYELTYVHQIGALFIAAGLNVCKDSLVSALNHLTSEQEAVVSARLRECVVEHQAALDAARELQACFSAPTFAQFTVSLIIICVTAFQLVSTLFKAIFIIPTLEKSNIMFILHETKVKVFFQMTGNLVRLLSMGTYLLNMTFQVFIYCYQGNQLSSSQVAGAAYSSPWYLYPVPLRRSLLIVMVRSRRVAKITAGGFTTLSLASFMAIIKASYSLFTLLQQVEEKK